MLVEIRKLLFLVPALLSADAFRQFELLQTSNENGYHSIYVCIYNA